MGSRGESGTSKGIDRPVFRNVDARWCGREESVLLDAIDTFGYGNWELIADLFKFECADKNFTVQDIIDHCNLIFGREALGAVWGSKILLERRTFLCDHTGPEDDALINSSDINAAKNLTPEQLNSIGYMPLREDFQGVKEHDIASLIPEIRFKDSYLQERCSRGNDSDEDVMQFIYDKYETEDEGDEVEDEDDGEKDEDDEVDDKENGIEDDVGHVEVEVENGEIEKYHKEDKMQTIDNSKADLNGKKREAKNVKKVELEETKEEKMALIIGEQMILGKKEAVGMEMGEKMSMSEKERNKKEAMLVEGVKETEVRTLIARSGKRVKTEIKIAESKGGIEKKEIEQNEKSIEIDSNDVKNIKSGTRTPDQDKGIRPPDKNTLIKKQIKSEESKEEYLSKEYGMSRKRIEYSKEAVIEDDLRETTEDEVANEEIDEESIGEEEQGDMSESLAADNDEKNKMNGKLEESCDVDENGLITDILLEAVDMYCKDMRDKALAIQLISCHRLVEHYFKYGKNQTNKETQQKMENRKPVDHRDVSWIYGVLKTFARFLEPEQLDNFMEDFEKENTLREKIDDLCKKLQNPDCAVFHLSSVHSDEDNGDIAESSSSDSECSEERYVDPEYTCTKKSSPDEEKQKCFSLDSEEPLSTESNSESKTHRSSEEKGKLESCDTGNGVMTSMTTSGAGHHISPTIHEVKSHCKDVDLESTHVGSYDSEHLEQKRSTTVSFDSKDLTEKCFDLESSEIRLPDPVCSDETVPHFEKHLAGISQENHCSKNSLVQVPDMTVIPCESSDNKTSISDDSNREIFSEEAGNLPNEDNFKETDPPLEVNKSHSLENPNAGRDNFEHNVSIEEDSAQEISNPEEAYNENLKSVSTDLELKRSAPISFDSKVLVEESFDLESSDIGPSDPVGSNVPDPYLKSSSIAGILQENQCEKISMPAPDVTIIPCESSEDKASISDESDREISTKEGTDHLQDEGNESPPEVNEACSPFENQNAEGSFEKISAEEDSVDAISNPEESSGKNIPQEASAVDRSAQSQGDQGRSRNCCHHIIRQKPRRKLEVRNLKFRKSSPESSEDDNSVGNDSVEKRKNARRLRKKKSNKGSSTDESSSDNSYDGIITIEGLGKGGSFNITGILKHLANLYPGGAEFIINSRFIRSVSMVAHNGFGDLVEIESEALNFKIPENSDGSIPKEFGTDSAVMVKEDDVDSMRVLMRELPITTWELSQDVETSNAKKRKAENISESKQSSIHSKRQKGTDGTNDGDKLNCKDQSSIPVEMMEETCDRSDDNTIDEEDLNAVKMDEKNEEASSQDGSNDEGSSRGQIENSADKERSSDEESSEDSCNNGISSRRASEKSKEDLSEEELEQEWREKEREQDSCEDVSGDQESGEEGSEDQELSGKVSEVQGSSEVSDQESNDKIPGVQESDEEIARVQESDEELSEVQESDEELSGVKESDSVLSREQELSDEESEKSLSEEEREHESGAEASDEQELSEEEGKRSPSLQEAESREMSEEESGQGSDQSLNFTVPENKEHEMKEYRTDSEVMMEDNIDSTRVLMHGSPSLTWEVSDVQTSKGRKRRAENMSKTYNNMKEQAINSDCSSIPTKRRKESGRSNDSTIDDEGQNSAQMDEDDESNEEANSQDESNDETSADEERFSDKTSSDESCNTSVSSEIVSDKEESQEQDLSEEKSAQELSEEEREESREDISADQESGEEGSVAQESEKEVSSGQESDEEISGRQKSDNDLSEQELSDAESERNLSEKETDEQESGEEVSDGQESSEGEDRKPSPCLEEAENEEMSEEENGRRSDEETKDHKSSEEVSDEEEHNLSVKATENQEMGEEENEQESDEKIRDQESSEEEKELESCEETGDEVSEEDNSQESGEETIDQEMSEEEKGSEEEMKNQESGEETKDHESDEDIKGRKLDDEIKDQESGEEKAKHQESGEETRDQESGDEAREQESSEEETEYEELSEVDSENQESNEELEDGLNEKSENLELSVMETEQILAQQETKIEDLSDDKAGQKLRNKKSVTFNATPDELPHEMACNKEFCIEVSDNDSNDGVAVKSLNKLDIKSVDSGIEKKVNHDLLNDKGDNCILTASGKLLRNPSNSLKDSEVKLGSEESTVTKWNEKCGEILDFGELADLNTAYQELINKENSTSLEMTNMEVDVGITHHDAMDIEVHENEANKADSVQELVSGEKRTGKLSEKKLDHITLNNKSLENKSFDGASSDNAKSVGEVSQAVSKNEVVALESSEDEVYEVMDEEAINKQSEGVKRIQIDSNDEVEADNESENQATDDELGSQPADVLNTKESKELEGGTDNESVYELEEDDESGAEENRMIIDKKSDNQKYQEKTEEALNIRTDEETVKELDHQDRF